MKNIFIKLKEALFFRPTLFTSMNYGICDILDLQINMKLDVGIKYISTTEFEINIYFNDGTKATLWNQNKYYAWLNSGHIGTFKFKGVRPKKSTMRRLRKEIVKYKIRYYPIQLIIESLILINDPYYNIPKSYNGILEEIYGWRLWILENTVTEFCKKRMGILFDEIRLMEHSVGIYHRY